MNSSLLKEWSMLAVWIVAILVGFGAMNVYATRPAQMASMGVQGWPSSSPRTPGKDTLVLFLHPRCSCSRATLSELETELPNLAGKVDVIVHFYYPSKDGESFASTSLLEMAKHMPGVEVRFDRDSLTAASFGARASGEAMYFSKNGDLRFHGGLTPARGHTGDSVGVQAIAALADGHTPAQVTSKVFGCQLKEELNHEVALAQ